MSIKEKIISNKFVDSLRVDMRVDEQAFSELISALRELVSEWTNRDIIDKQIMQEIYVIPAIIRGASDSFRGRLPSISERLDEMAIEVDELILEALA